MNFHILFFYSFAVTEIFALPQLDLVSQKPVCVTNPRPLCVMNKFDGCCQKDPKYCPLEEYICEEIGYDGCCSEGGIGKLW
jgi:hypothetical protein